VSNVKEIVEGLLLSVDGGLAAAVTDSSGMLIASSGTGVDIELAAAGISEVVRAKMKTMKTLGLNDKIEDILITLGKQYHIIRPTEKYEDVFIYLVVDRAKGNLALARRQVLQTEKILVV
jgi:predicted regulator of Ras-like GTPase activity (Roadblock/LC7/MglB family)